MLPALGQPGSSGGELVPRRMCGARVRTTRRTAPYEAPDGEPAAAQRTPRPAPAPHGKCPGTVSRGPGRPRARQRPGRRLFFTASERDVFWEERKTCKVTRSRLCAPFPVPPRPPWREVPTQPRRPRRGQALTAGPPGRKTLPVHVGSQCPACFSRLTSVSLKFTVPSNVTSRGNNHWGQV